MPEDLQFTAGELKHLLDKIKRGDILTHEDVDGAVGRNSTLAKERGMLGNDGDTEVVLPGALYQIFQEACPAFIVVECSGFINNQLAWNERPKTGCPDEMRNQKEA